MLVPLIRRYCSGRGQAEWTATPGPARSICPPCGLRPAFEKRATWSCWSSAATAMNEGQFAGWLTALTVAGRSLSLPAAAMIRAPRRSDRLPTCSNTAEGGVSARVGAPSDIETTAHWLTIAHWMPARMLRSVPLPWLLNTLPANTSALVATP